MSDGRRLEWRLVLGLAVIAGGVYAALTILGLIHGAEGLVVLGVLAIIALVVALKVHHRPVLNGLAAGFFAGLVAIELQALFLPLYFANNPEYAEIEIPFGLPPRLGTAVLGPINALIAGLLVAAVVWVLSRWVLRRSRSGEAR